MLRILFALSCFCFITTTILDNAIHKETTKETLFSAIQTGDKELVSACLANQNIDVNAIYFINVTEVSVPVTPLMIAVSHAIFNGSSFEIVSMLLNAGAKIDLEVDTPIFDSSFKVTSWNKTTALKVVETSAKGISEGELSGISDEALKQKILDCKARACDLLKLFKPLIAT